jgi:alpha-beta hydrolase superfamily lysophospholipase
MVAGRAAPGDRLSGAGRVREKRPNGGARPGVTVGEDSGMRTIASGPRPPRPPGARPVRRAALLVLALVLALVAGCSGGRRLVEGAIGMDHEAPFYTLPDPVPPGPPGRLVRSEPLPDGPPGADAWRILYHSRDLRGADVVVSGVVAAPRGPVPPGGRPIVSWGHPTTGAARRCAPSLGIDPFDLLEGLRDLLSAGYVVVATDYPGMGAAGPDSYLIGTSEGNSMLDAARAARQLPTGAGRNLLLWGHSQGGQAVLFAAQSAPGYAPDLDLRGAAVAAPATDLAGLLKTDIGDISGVTIGSYAFDAYGSVYRSTPGVTLSNILTPAGAAATPAMAQLCLFGQNGELHRIAQPLIGHYLSGDPAVTQPWAGLLSQNTPGATSLTVPLFIAQGDVDALIKPALTWQFADHECAIGTHVTRLPIPDTGHGMVALRALPTLLPWFGRALSGTEPVPAGC